jgi:adenylate cyclase class 2
MLEVEMKFPVVDFATVERCLTAWGARTEALRADVDLYFNSPDRDFAQTDEAFRLRRIGAANFATYKGPKRDLQTKTRTEIEVGLAEGAQAAADFTQLVICLGYRPVAEVRKQRRVFHLSREGFSLEVCLDEVADLGRFIELEIQAPEESMEKAKSVLSKLAGELGLTRSERLSYLQLLLARRSS